MIARGRANTLPAMTINESTLIFLAGQAIVLISAVFVAYLGIARHIVRMTTNVEHALTQILQQRADHEGLRNQVHGISRKVERHDTIIQLQNVKNAREAAEITRQAACSDRD